MLRQKRCSRPSVLLTYLLAGSCTALAGCRKNEFVPVAGKVLFKGEPLTKGDVLFLPDAAKDNTSQHRPVGSINPEGNYVLRSGIHLGAPPGHYVVTVVANEPTTREKMERRVPMKSYIPQRYGDPKTSRLAVEVRAGAPVGSYDRRLDP
jgi:hypothetical protein